MIGTIITVVVGIVNVIILVTIKFNDMKHMDKKLDRVASKLEEICERVSTLEGQVNK